MIIPSIKDKINIDWLNNNSETFINYIAKHHSIFDIAHTLLNYETMDDKYISNLIKDIEKSDKKFIREQKSRAKKLKVTSEPKTTIEKKNEIIEKAVLDNLKIKDEDDLLD